MCAFPDCDRPGRHKGYCNTHYHQQRRSGEMWPIGSPRSRSREKGAGGTCSQCERPHVALGYCHGHYMQFKRNGYTWPLGSRKPQEAMPPCGLSDCEREQRRGKSGLCDYHARWNAQHVRDYGIDLFERERLLAEQGGVCAGCSHGVDLHLDHCHRTGKVRGLLCGNCNRALGLIGDSPDTLRGLLAYVEGR